MLNSGDLSVNFELLGGESTPVVFKAPDGKLYQALAVIRKPNEALVVVDLIDADRDRDGDPQFWGRPTDDYKPL